VDEELTDLDAEQQRADLDEEPRLLEHLTSGRLRRRLPGLHPAAGQGPQALGRLLPTPHQEKPAGAVADDGAGAQHRGRFLLAARRGHSLQAKSRCPTKGTKPTCWSS
jgi:hypothetical protein